jgi:methylenetetrahydrofolate dehydrogenase (NADP+) / methenyltetrahydrofolate cyclohydrolase
MNIKDYTTIQKQKLADEIKAVQNKPHLVIIQANNDVGSNSYIKGKMLDCVEVEINATHIKLDVDITQKELLKIITKYNLDKSVHGIIVQLPLGPNIDKDIIKTAILPEKDVDGFHPMSNFKPCTPKGIIDYLKFLKYDFIGKNAVIIGRSLIVGRPLSSMLIDESANVTVLHSKTKTEDVNFYLLHADLICLAIGQKWFLKNQTLKSTAYVIDVGISRDNETIYGDAYPNLPVALQTPVPKGVGLLTRLTLLNNVWEAYKRAI